MEAVAFAILASVVLVLVDRNKQWKAFFRICKYGCVALVVTGFYLFYRWEGITDGIAQGLGAVLLTVIGLFVIALFAVQVLVLINSAYAQLKKRRAAHAAPRSARS